jgi:tRNA (cytidine32/uridine32-2'-O)-methyltransferase
MMSMLSTKARACLTVVLVGARNPQNIGAAARALHDFGFADLRIVNEYGAPFEAAQLEATQLVAVNSAVMAESVMAAARRFDTLAEALADCRLAVATTAIGERALAMPVEPIATAAPHMLAALEHAALATPGQRVALVFGSEKTGLTNEQLSHCQRLVTIPLYQPLDAEGAPQRHLSMNLGQSVAVCLYELTRGGLEQARALPVYESTAATGDDRERLTQQLLVTMQATGYTRRFPANSREAVVRRLAANLATSRDEATTWMGFLKMCGRSIE